MAPIRRVKDLLELSWPIVTGGGLENEARRAAWRDAWQILRELGILSARIVGLRCPCCGGTKRILPEDQLDDGSPIDETMPCPVCKGQPLATLVEKHSWEAAVCRSAGLNLAFHTKEEARAYYGKVARPGSQDFDRWWSGLESWLIPVAAALLAGRVLPAEVLGRLRLDGSKVDPGQRRFRFVTVERIRQVFELEQIEDRVLAIVGLDGKELDHHDSADDASPAHAGMGGAGEGASD